MKTLTVAQMREADRRCIEEIGIPGVVLMNNAGAAVFREIHAGPVGIVCGKGNNGGDGFVVARLALMAGHETRLLLLAEPKSIRGDAEIFMRAYRNLGGEILAVTEPQMATQAVRDLASCACLVDAMLGTGITGEVRGVFRAAIEAWPALPTTVAVDIPSGLDAGTGVPCGACVRAHATVTFQCAKRGFLNPAAAEFLGRLTVADIGIPSVCTDDDAWRARRSQA